MKRLIITADDFGLTEKINQGIMEGHRHGIITSVSLLANGHAYEAAIRLSAQAPQLGVGVHLNLTEGQPVSSPASIPTLVDGKGQFLRSPFVLARQILTGKVSLSEIEMELRAQIEKVSSSRLDISHLDGHKHVHILPPIFDIVVRLAREYKIKAVRCPLERLSVPVLLGRARLAKTKILKQFLWGRAVALVSSVLKRRLEQAGLQCARYFYGITHTGFFDKDVLRRILCRLPDGISELMCHPGYVDDALRRTPTRLLEQREQELYLLTQPETRRLIEAQAIELINFRNVVETL